MVTEPVLSLQGVVQGKSIPLGDGHIRKITSAMKQWLYQDQYIKPEESIIVRPRQTGGLGVHSVHSKANPKFRRRLDHQAMWEWTTPEEGTTWM